MINKSKVILMLNSSTGHTWSSKALMKTMEKYSLPWTPSWKLQQSVQMPTDFPFIYLISQGESTVEMERESDNISLL